MDMRFHVKLRYVQRMMGIESVEEAKKFIEENEYEVIYKLLDFVNKAELLIMNYAPARRDTLDYYINDETLIVLKPNKEEIVTLFDITLDLDNEQNSKKIIEYVKTIRKNNNRIKKIKSRQKKQDLITHHLEYMINYLPNDIGNSLIEKIKFDIKQSIGICKEFATQENALRMENREMMSEMFVKLDISTATNK